MNVDPFNSVSAEQELSEAITRDGRRLVNFFTLAPTAIAMDNEGRCFAYRLTSMDNAPIFDELSLANALRLYSMASQIQIDASFGDALPDFLHLAADKLPSQNR